MVGEAELSAGKGLLRDMDTKVQEEVDINLSIIKKALGSDEREQTN